MPKHPDFLKIYKRFIKQYGPEKGKQFYYAWLRKKGYDDTKPFPKKKEKKELMCRIRGCEIKESPEAYHVEGLIATSHIDDLDMVEGIDMPDMIPKETLDSFAEQMNTQPEARVMGVHHSEGKSINPEYFGTADVENTPVAVIPLSDGEWGLFVDTVLLKDDPKTPEIIKRFEDGDLNAFSITFDTNNFTTTDFEWVNDQLVRVLNPDTKLYGYTAANNPINPNTIATGHGFKEFKELILTELNKTKEDRKMTNKEQKELELKEAAEKAKKELEIKEAAEKAKKELEEKEAEEKAEKEAAEKANQTEDEKKAAEAKEFNQWKTDKKQTEQKEVLNTMVTGIVGGMLKKMDIKEKVLKDNEPPKSKSPALEVKAFMEIIEKPGTVELTEQFRRAGAVCDAINLDWHNSITPTAESREYKNFGVNGRMLEYKGLGITTNQETDADYIQSSAELQDVYDPVIYNALNQATVAWSLFAKDDYSKKGNNQVQFTLKTVANASAAFYTGNAVVSGNVTRQKYQTKFKKIQVGVSVDGDMIAAARGGPVSDVFAQEVMDSTIDMLAVLNANLFGIKGLETDAETIGFHYIAESATYTTLYNLSRAVAAYKLAPDSAGDTYINQASTVVSMTNLRAAKRQALAEGATKSNLVFITNSVQGDMLRGKFDDSRRMLTAKDTDFGFSTDLWVDGIPVFEDEDCDTDDWFLIDLETHRAAIWIPPTIERLGKSADSEDAFVKMYFAIYNRAPRRLVQIYGCATS